MKHTHPTTNYNNYKFFHGMEPVLFCIFLSAVAVAETLFFSEVVNRSAARSTRRWATDREPHLFEPRAFPFRAVLWLVVSTTTSKTTQHSFTILNLYCSADILLFNELVKRSEARVIRWWAAGKECHLFKLRGVPISSDFSGPQLLYKLPLPRYACAVLPRTFDAKCLVSFLAPTWHCNSSNLLT